MLPPEWSYGGQKQLPETIQYPMQLSIRLRPRRHPGPLHRRYRVRRGPIRRLPTPYHIPRTQQCRPCQRLCRRGHQHRIPGRFRSALWLPPKTKIKARNTPTVREVRYLECLMGDNLTAAATFCNHLFGVVVY